MKEDKHKMTEQSLPFDFFADESDPVEQSATEPAETDASQAAADKKSVVEQQLPLLFDELSVAVGDEETASDFVTATFGTGGNGLHYNFGEIYGEMRFYFDKESGNYMIMPSDSYALRSEVTSVEKKDGKLIANVEIDGTDETSCIMYLEFSVKSDTIQILACVRYDIS